MDSGGYISVDIGDLTRAVKQPYVLAALVRPYIQQGRGRGGSVDPSDMRIPHELVQQWLTHGDLTLLPEPTPDALGKLPYASPAGFLKKYRFDDPRVNTLADSIHIAD